MAMEDETHVTTLSGTDVDGDTFIYAVINHPSSLINTDSTSREPCFVSFNTFIVTNGQDYRFGVG